MNRIIKFRAWTGTEMTATVAVAGNGFLSTWDSGNAFTGPMLSSVNWEIMQFTGLLDKNKKEIYEGDVCRFRWNPILNQPGTLFEFTLPVTYYIGWGCYVFHITSNKMKKKQRDMFTDYGMEERYVAIGTPIMYNDEGEGVEVIGNIFENPDLLK